MFFVLSKTLGIMLLPINLLIGIGVIGAILLLTRFARLGRRLMVGSLLLLAEASAEGKVNRGGMIYPTFSTKCS